MADSCRVIAEKKKFNCLTPEKFKKERKRAARQESYWRRKVSPNGDSVKRNTHHNHFDLFVVVFLAFQIRHIAIVVVFYRLMLVVSFMQFFLFKRYVFVVLSKLWWHLKVAFWKNFLAETYAYFISQEFFWKFWTAVLILLVCYVAFGKQWRNYVYYLEM